LKIAHQWVMNLLMEFEWFNENNPDLPCWMIWKHEPVGACKKTDFKISNFDKPQKEEILLLTACISLKAILHVIFFELLIFYLKRYKSLPYAKLYKFICTRLCTKRLNFLFY
jgi:hypothetical protein